MKLAVKMTSENFTNRLISPLDLVKICRRIGLILVSVFSSTELSGFSHRFQNPQKINFEYLSNLTLTYEAKIEWLNENYPTTLTQLKRIMKTQLAPESVRETSVPNLKKGDFIVNLGEILEIDELTNLYSIVILRNNQKQVFTFNKNDRLLLRKKASN